MCCQEFDCLKTTLSSYRERKREAEDSEETPETKKPRLTDEHNAEELGNIPETETDMEPTKGCPSTQESLLSTSKRGGKGRKGEATEGSGSFKEQPYTFLAPEDPILLNCM